MEKIITYFGQPAKVACDEKCEKAWGIAKRPKEQLSDDADDVVYLADDELGIAPIDPMTEEGGERKPINNKVYQTNGALDNVKDALCLKEVS